MGVVCEVRGSSLGVKWLGVGLGAAQGEASNGLGVEAEFAPDQTVRSGGINEQVVGEARDPTGGVGAAQKDNGRVCAGGQARGGQGWRAGAVSRRAGVLRCWAVTKQSERGRLAHLRRPNHGRASFG